MEKPLIFLAFCYDKHPKKYLPHLGKEEEELKVILDDYQNVKQWGTYRTLSTTTSERLVEQVQSHTAPMIIFHFAGHAGKGGIQLVDLLGKPIQLSTENLPILLKDLVAPDPESLGLHLVVLNGCATYGNVDKLQNIGVPAIIATHSEVGDEEALKFAKGLYRALVKGSDLRTAFGQAKIAIDPGEGDRIFRDSKKGKTNSSDFEWGLYCLNDEDLNWKLKPKDLKRKNASAFKRKPELISVEGGAFLMGTNRKSAFDHEKPRRKVEIDSFEIGIHPVTNAQFEYFIRETKREYEIHIKKRHECIQQAFPGNYKEILNPELNYPAAFVNWNDAEAFCLWLSKVEEKIYRLPTEAEWEYAAKGGVYNKRYTYSGGNYPQDIACYGMDSLKPVKTKGPNQLGLFDMSGLVWEWCKDFYSPVYYHGRNKKNPKGPIKGIGKVLRGGSWANSSSMIRVSHRYYLSPDHASNCIGFRCVEIKSLPL